MGSCGAVFMVPEDTGEHPQDAVGKTHSGEHPLSLLAVSDQPLLSKSADLLRADENTPVKGIKSMAAVYSQVLPGIPAAIVSQIADDCSNHTGSTIGKVAESAALGFGTAVLLARSPVLAKSLLTAAGIGTSALFIGSTARFSMDAASASDKEAQSNLSASALNSIGKLGANLIETSPGLIVGAGSGYMLSSRVERLSSIANAVRDNAELKVRQWMPEQFHYVGLDAKTIAGVTSGQSGDLNLMRASEEMLSKTPWRGVEDGRFFKPAGDTVKMSARLPGTEFETIMGRRAQSMFHTHEDSLLPTTGDFNSVYNTGVIGIPKRGVLTFYEGTGKEAQSISALYKAKRVDQADQALESLQNRTFNSLIVEPSRQLAVRVELRANAVRNRLEPSSIQTLDYADTVKKLSKWDGKLNIGSIDTSAEALLKPGMADLLRKIVTDSGI